MRDIELEEPYASLVREARDVASQLEPYAVEADNSSVLSEPVAAILRSSGLLALMVPAEYGGRFARIDPFAVCLVREVLMATCSHADSMFALQGIGSYAITCSGTDDQKARWLPAVATGQALAAIALTEPGAGSDLKSLTTTATTVDGHVVVNGRKSFISNAGAASLYLVLAREGSGFSLFLVPADAPGLTIEQCPELMAAHVLGDLDFRDVRLPESSRVGPAGGAMNLVLSTLSVFRVSVAGAAVGLAQVALDEATRHARDRVQFGRPLYRLGPVAGLLADSWSELAAARLLTYDAARRASKDPLASLEYSSLAKLNATEAACRVADRCVQVMGRWGVIRDSRIERCYRQARAMRVYEGASEVLRLGIARGLAEDLG